MVNKSASLDEFPPSETDVSIDCLLSQVLTTHLQSKAKGIIVTSIQFVAVESSIFLTIRDYDIESEVIQYGFYAVLGLAAVYVNVLGVFLFLHSMLHTNRKMSTSQEVADAFTSTDHIAFFDGCLQIPFPIIYRGNLWCAPYMAWTIFVTIIAGGVVIFQFEWEKLSNAILATLIAGTLLLFQITADFLEYWMLSRNQLAIEAAAE